MDQQFPISAARCHFELVVFQFAGQTMLRAVVEDLLPVIFETLSNSGALVAPPEAQCSCFFGALERPPKLPFFFRLPSLTAGTTSRMEPFFRVVDTIVPFEQRRLGRFRLLSSGVSSLQQFFPHIEFISFALLTEFANTASIAETSPVCQAQRTAPYRRAVRSMKNVGASCLNQRQPFFFREFTEMPRKYLKQLAERSCPLLW